MTYKKQSIVAVHGLNPTCQDDHAMRTWTTPLREKLWLRDDLPSEFPDVRVLMYTYDSRPVFTSNEKLLTFEADALLSSLEMERDDVFTQQLKPN